MIDDFVLRFRSFENLDTYGKTSLTGALTKPKLYAEQEALTVNLKQLKEDMSGIPPAGKIGGRPIGLDFESYTPWFTRYREMVSQFQGVSEHETFHHPVACK